MKKIKIKQEQIPLELFSTMGCRTQNGSDINAIESYKTNIQSVIKNGTTLDSMYSAAQKDGRGNICPVTIILPTLAMEAKEKSETDGTDIVECFMNILNDNISAGFKMLRERYDWICKQDPRSGAFMYTNNTMAGYDGKNIESALKHGTLALGQLGLAETLQILVGCNQLNKIGFDLACKIEQLFKDRCKEQKEKEHLNYGVYYTPKCNK